MPDNQAVSRSSARLTIVPTPIGNLGDITERARRALEAADVVFCEDTRVTGKLLAALGMNKHLERLDENLMGEKADKVLECLHRGSSVAYCSDAGMPGVSDPGLRLVDQARKAGLPVEVLPGASAVDTAYVASGFTNAHFFFGGFFPRKLGEQLSLLDSLRKLDAVLIFYESPKRLAASLSVLAQAFPLREVAVCRELTKLYEEVVRGKLPEVSDRFTQRQREGTLKGEIVIVVDGPNEQEIQGRKLQAQTDARGRARELLSRGLRVKDVAKRIAAEFELARNDAYAVALEMVEAFSNSETSAAHSQVANGVGSAAEHSEVAADNSDNPAKSSEDFPKTAGSV